MIAGFAIVFLAVSLIVALSVRPKRAIVAIPVTLIASALLIEEAGVAPRIAIMIALVAAMVLAVWNTGSATSTTAPPPATAAWDRLAASAGMLTRGRVAAVRQRRDALVMRNDDIDPFSTFGELRLKLERRVPELIDNYLDEAALAPKLRRHVLMGELLGEVERIVARAEAVDPLALARADRRKALRSHLGGGSES
ncbi:hypothetical protein [Sphingomonas sp. RS2018]